MASKSGNAAEPAEAREEAAEAPLLDTITAERMRAEAAEWERLTDKATISLVKMLLAGADALDRLAEADAVIKQNYRSKSEDALPHQEYWRLTDEALKRHAARQTEAQPQPSSPAK